MSRQLTQPHSNNILVGNLLIHTKYKYRQKVVKDLSNVYTYFYQVTQQFTKYNIEQNLQLLKKQLEYLIILNLKQFNTDVQLVVLVVYKTHLELLEAAIAQNSNILFYYYSMHRMFLRDGVRALLYIVTSNQMRIITIAKLLDLLFLQDNNIERKEQGQLPF